MEKTGTYQEYARRAIEKFEARDAAKRDLLVNAVRGREVLTVLDLGCGPGQELLPFLEKTGAHCVGVDIAEEIGAVAGEFVGRFGHGSRVSFVRSRGESLAFADASFDLVLCRVALPYMDNGRTIAEVARILKPNGVFLLKTHGWRFLASMLLERLKTGSPRMIAYPLICLAASFWHVMTGRQLVRGFWSGKEIFQTKGTLEREFVRNGLEIDGSLSDSTEEAPSFIIVKRGALHLLMWLCVFGEYPPAI